MSEAIALGTANVVADLGTANVVADLGLPDAAERQTKTRLAMALNRIIKDQRLKQVDAARLLGVPQPKVSALVN
jgi:predicted XRE-type DNA-binding protein